MSSVDMFSRLGLCLFPFLVYLVNAAPKCNDADLRACMRELKALTNNPDLAFAQTENELTQTCRHLQDAMQCVNNFTSRCFDNMQRDMYKQLTGGAQSLLSDLCTEDSDFRKEYLVHAGCYRNLSADYKRCADNYLVQQEHAKKEDMPVQDKLRKSCCLFDGYKECTRVAVEEKCSKEAAVLGEEIVTKAGGPLVQSHCSQFKHNTDSCMFMSSGLSFHSVSIQQILILLAAVSSSMLISQFHL